MQNRINTCELNEAVRLSNYKYMTDDEKNEANKIAEHLATHYLNAVWDTVGSKGISSEDVYNMQDLYNEVKLQVVSTYEKILTDKVLKFLKLKRKKRGEKINLGDVKDIIKYKLYNKPKRKMACFMLDLPYDIYHLVNRR